MFFSVRIQRPINDGGADHRERLLATTSTTSSPAENIVGGSGTTHLCVDLAGLIDVHVRDDRADLSVRQLCAFVSPVTPAPTASVAAAATDASATAPAVATANSTASAADATTADASTAATACSRTLRLQVLLDQFGDDGVNVRRCHPAAVAVSASSRER